MSIEREQKLYDALKRITAYMAPDELRRVSEKKYGLGGDEAIEMAYENVLEEARRTIKSMRRPASPQQAGGGDIAVREALRQIIDADDRQALTQQLIDVGRAALESEEAPKEPMSDADVLAIEVLQYNFGLNGGAGPVSKKGWKIIRAIEAHHGIGSAAGINTRAQEGKQ
jgi:vancomycin resistance protein YoaR